MGSRFGQDDPWCAGELRLFRQPMSRRVLDTGAHFFWARYTGKDALSLLGRRVEWAKELIDLRNSNTIVTPVLVEFLCGARTNTERELFRAFLAPFQILDNREVAPDDWDCTQKYAERIPRDGKPRELGDCLIKALAEKYRRSVDSLETRFPGR
ncbi:MAG: hypothetical protein U0793_03780 [Gemmataceae bacterium]